jgi:hypothetical protein
MLPGDVRREVYDVAEDIIAVFPNYTVEDPWCVVGTVLLWTARAVVELRGRVAAVEKDEPK